MEQYFVVAPGENEKLFFVNVEHEAVDRLSANNFIHGSIICFSWKGKHFKLKVVKLSHSRNDIGHAGFKSEFFSERFNHLTSSAEFFASWLNEGNNLWYNDDVLEK